MKCQDCGSEIGYEKVEVDIGQAKQIVDYCKKCGACYFMGSYRGNLSTYHNWEILE